MNDNGQKQRQLIARWIEPNPHKPGDDEARIRGTGVPVWALIGYLPAVGDAVEQVALDYELPPASIRVRWPVGACMFDWDDANRAHIRRHGVEPHEAEEAWLDPRSVPVDATRLEGEWREAIVGVTHAGRLLHVAWTERDGRIRVFEARRPTRREARLYFRQ